ncbi:MAG: hypothetical protein AABY09_00940, partial [Nanoarchaeota archaeon]
RGVNFDYAYAEYSAILKSVSGKSTYVNFFFPGFVYIDPIADGPSYVVLDQSSQLLYFPYYRDVDKLEVYDSDRRLVLSYDLSDYRICVLDGKCSVAEDVNTCPEDCRAGAVKPSENVAEETAQVSGQPSQESQEPKGLYVIIIVILALILVAFMMNRLSSKRKGQITLFIILGIVIVFAIGIGLYFSGAISQLQEQKESVEAAKALSQSKDVQAYVESCIADSLRFVVPAVFRNGGYYAPKDRVIYLHYDVPVYMEQGKESLPTKESIEREIASGVDSALPACLAGIQEEVKVSGVPESEVTITKGKIIADTQIPLIVQGDVESKLVGFYAEHDADVMPAYQESLSLYNEVKGIKGVVPLSMLAFLAEKKDYKFVSDNVDGAQLYILRFDSYKFDDKPIEYSFAVRNPLKEGEHIILEGIDYSEMFGFIIEDQTPQSG